MNSQACKEAIAQYVREHPGCVASQFVTKDQPVDETPAQNPETWKRFEKRLDDLYNRGGRKIWRRGFQNSAYEDGDSLRAYTFDDGNKILNIIIQGE